MNSRQLNYTARSPASMSPSAPSPPRSAQATPQQPPTPSYPLHIPQPKLSKAVKLYIVYRKAVDEDAREKELARSIAEPAPRLGVQPQLNVPPSPGNHSPASPSASWVRAGSVGSAHEGLTESLIDFSGNESISSSKANGVELTSHTGQKVKQPRGRGRLSKAAKAKAALVRWLGACTVCRFRRVPCPMNHHDIAALDQARQLRNRSKRPISDHDDQQYAQRQRQYSSTPTSPPAYLSPVQSPIATSVSVDQSLLGIGRKYQQLPSHNRLSISTDTPSPIGADPLEFSVQPPTNFGNTDPSTIDWAALGLGSAFAPYEEGKFLPLGVLRQYFNGWVWACQFNGCHESFGDEETLQNHFETHSAFTRIHPPYRYVCPVCSSPNDIPTAVCMRTGCPGTPETLIWGRSKSPSQRRQLSQSADQEQFPYGTWDFSFSPTIPDINFTSPTSVNTNTMDNLDGHAFHGSNQNGSSNCYFSYQGDTTPGAQSSHSGDFSDYQQPMHAAHLLCHS